jgi:manganese oxidase
VTADGGMTHFRDHVTVVQKGLTHVYGDGKPVEGIAAEQVLSEDTEDGGAMAINYGSEPLWFRFGLPANMPLTGPGSLRDIPPNNHEAYSNSLAGVGGDPTVPVLTAVAGEEFRMHVLEPAGTARGSVFNLHGHVWQRAPYVCPGSSYLGLTNVCLKTGFFPTLPGFEVGSRAIGINPLSMYLGGQDSILPAAHFDIVLPKAGGENAIPGDYLYKDQAGFGNLGGLWGIVRVECPKGHEPSEGHCT